MTSATPNGYKDRKDSLALIRAAIHRNAARRREMSDINALVADLGFLSISATTRDFDPDVSQITFARLVLAASANDPLPEPGSSRLPSRPLLHTVVQYYLTHVSSLYPAFPNPDPALAPLIDELYQDQDACTVRQDRSPDLWLILMVLAIGSLAQSRSSRDQWYADGVEFAARAMVHADGALMPGRMTQMQSLLLLTQYAILDPAHFDSWHLIGFTSRAVIDLGLHKDPPRPEAGEKTAMEARRTLFYSIYSLDRAISMVHARPFSFTDLSVRVALPSTRQSPSPSSYLFALRRLQSGWYQTLFQSSGPLPDATSFIFQSCHEMRQWFGSLPSHLDSGLRAMFELELLYSYVYCIAPSARATDMSDYNRWLIFEYAMAYMHRAVRLVDAAVGTPLYTYHDALRLYFMASQFVAVLLDAAGRLLAPHDVPSPPKGQSPPLLPPERQDGTSDETPVHRSLMCLEQVAHTLGRFAERWDDARVLLESFEALSAGLVARLQKNGGTDGGLGG